MKGRAHLFVALAVALLAGSASAGPTPEDTFLPWAQALPPTPHPEPAYHYGQEVWSAVAALVVAHPDTVHVRRFGTTTLQEPLWAVTVTPPPSPEGDLRKLLVFANIHALEWIPTEDALAFLQEVAAAPRAGVEVTVVPILNPDGRARVERDLLAGRNVYRRGNGANVDLNRDFAVNRTPRAVWEPLLPARYASSPAPLSQPESRALDALAAAERYDVAVSLHAYGGFLYYPWTGRWERPPDWRAFDALALRMQAAMGPHAYKPRQLSRWGFFFRAQGTEIDHLYGEYGTLAYLVETTRSGLSPWRPREWSTYFRWYNPRDPEPHVRAGRAMLGGLLDAMAEPGFTRSKGVPALPPQEARTPRADRPTTAATTLHNRHP